MELALGTVQFGLPYGIAGRGEPVPAAQVRDILRCAWEGGVRLLDTAPGYGDIEQRLRPAMAGLGFRVVSKVPALPEGADAAWAARQIHLSRERLGDALVAMLFHRAEDLAGEVAARVWDVVREALPDEVALGVSCYEPEILRELSTRYSIEVAQVPGNVLDQRFFQSRVPTRTPRLHLRSVFLQGVLLMSPTAVAQRLPIAMAAVDRWQRWCAERAMTPLVAALAIARAHPTATHCVVGVDDTAQLEAILAAWHAAPPLAAPDLAVGDARIIDPRRWEIAP